MRKSYRWLLAATLLATAVIMSLDQPNESKSLAPAPIGGQPERHQVSQLTVNGIAPTPQVTDTPPLILRPTLPPALRDIFARPSQPKQEAPQKQPQPVEAFIEPAPPPNIRFLGSFTDPRGTLMLYLSQGETELEAKVGESLPNGYVVESATADEVRLVYPRLGTKVIVPVSPEQ